MQFDFNTLNLCSKNIYNSICDENENVNKKSTNKKFPNFFQEIYHAGSMEQFIKYAFDNSRNSRKRMTRKKSIKSSNTLRTFYYLFYILKKGIFVKIRDGKLKVFLPFSNAMYKNDWGLFLDDSKDIVIQERKRLVKKSKKINKVNKFELDIDSNPENWYANNCFFRNTVYKNGSLKGLMDEGDKSVKNFLYMLTVVCNKFKINDTEFFINVRDFPVLRKDQKHPYILIYKSLGIPVPKFDTSDMKIMSQCKSDLFKDILVPNDDDIKLLLCPVNKNYQTDWTKKINKAIFRGSASGCGTDIVSNKRLQLVKESMDNKFIDAKITSFAERLRLDPKIFEFSYIDKNKFKTYKGSKLSDIEQSQYKFVINVEGNVAAFRLARELAYGSVILKIDSQWKLWYEEGNSLCPDTIKGYVINDTNYNNCHYVKVPGPESIHDVILWLLNNDSIARIIAQNALDYYNKNFRDSDFMMSYMASVINNI